MNVLTNDSSDAKNSKRESNRITDQSVDRGRLFCQQCLDMPSSNPSIAQLQRAIQITEQIEALDVELKRILGNGAGPQAKTEAVVEPKLTKKRTMSASARARIAAAQRARWAKSKGAEAGTAIEARPATKATKSGKKKRTMSPEARARIVAAQKKRWAKFKKAKK